MHSRSPSWSPPDTTPVPSPHRSPPRPHDRSNTRRFEASPTQGNSEGPSFISCTAPSSATTTYTSRLRRSWHTQVLIIARQRSTRSLINCIFRASSRRKLRTNRGKISRSAPWALASKRLRRMVARPSSTGSRVISRSTAIAPPFRYAQPWGRSNRRISSSTTGLFVHFARNLDPGGRDRLIWPRGDGLIWPHLVAAAAGSPLLTDTPGLGCDGLIWPHLTVVINVVLIIGRGRGGVEGGAVRSDPQGPAG